MIYYMAVMHIPYRRLNRHPSGWGKVGPPKSCEGIGLDLSLRKIDVFGFNEVMLDCPTRISSHNSIAEVKACVHF